MNSDFEGRDEALAAYPKSHRQRQRKPKRPTDNHRGREQRQQFSLAARARLVLPKGGRDER